MTSAMRRPGIVAGRKLLPVPRAAHFVRPAADRAHELGPTGLDTADNEILSFCQSSSRSPRHRLGPSFHLHSSSSAARLSRIVRPVGSDAAGEIDRAKTYPTLPIREALTNFLADAESGLLTDLLIIRGA